MHSQPEALRRLDQAIPEELVIVFCRKNYLAAVSAQNHVLRLARHKVARQAGQLQSMEDEPARILP